MKCTTRTIVEPKRGGRSIPSILANPYGSLATSSTKARAASETDSLFVPEEATKILCRLSRDFSIEFNTPAGKTGEKPNIARKAWKKLQAKQQEMAQ